MLGKSNKDGKDLSLVDMQKIDQLLSGKQTRLKIEDVGVKLGDKYLSKGDILTSPCQNGYFYLMKYLGGGRYRSDDGPVLQTSPSWQCPRDKYRYENLFSVYLDLTRPTNGSITLSSMLHN